VPRAVEVHLGELAASILRVGERDQLGREGEVLRREHAADGARRTGESGATVAAGSAPGGAQRQQRRKQRRPHWQMTRHALKSECSSEGMSLLGKTRSDTNTCMAHGILPSGPRWHHANGPKETLRSLPSALTVLAGLGSLIQPLLSLRRRP